jgi:hypothetical protein
MLFHNLVSHESPLVLRKYARSFRNGSPTVAINTGADAMVANRIGFMSDSARRFVISFKLSARGSSPDWMHRVRRRVCLGDIVGYAANPAKCLELVRSLDVRLMGNHAPLQAMTLLTTCAMSQGWGSPVANWLSNGISYLSG